MVKFLFHFSFFCIKENFIFPLINVQAKPTSIRDAIKKWEEKNGQSASDALEVSLIFQWPPIEKMDHNLGNLVKCELVRTT